MSVRDAGSDRGEHSEGKGKSVDSFPLNIRVVKIM